MRDAKENRPITHDGLSERGTTRSLFKLGGYQFRLRDKACEIKISLRRWRDFARAGAHGEAVRAMVKS